MTKLDGTAKGGVVISIKEELGVPVRWIGVGEGMDDLRPFNAKEFANAPVSYTHLDVYKRQQQGDVETGLVFSGNNMRKVDKIMPVKDIFAQLKQQVAEID